MTVCRASSPAGGEGRRGAAARARRAQGFTLLEILVALAVFGFLVVGLTQGTRFGLRAWQVQARTIRAESDLDATDRVLRQLIERMDAGTEDRDPAIAGNGNDVAFASELDDPASGARMPVDVRLSLQNGSLVLVVAPHRHAAGGGPEAERSAVLLSGVSSFSIAYWRAYPRTGAPGWVASWKEPELPALLRLHIGFPPADGRHWPDIVAAPMKQRPD